MPPGAAVPALVENVVALAVLPDRAAGDTGAPLAPAYGYDSRDTTNTLTLHQLPPRLRLALVAIDEPSAERLAAQNGANPPALVASGAFQQASTQTSTPSTPRSRCRRFPIASTSAKSSFPARRGPAPRRSEEEPRACAPPRTAAAALPASCSSSRSPRWRS